MTDGIFQSALASFILFSPERQANALGAALAFAVVLLPYSIIGPFVGTILDRVSRQRAIAFSNLIRAITLSIIALLLFQGHTGIEITIFVLISSRILSIIDCKPKPSFVDNQDFNLFNELNIDSWSPSLCSFINFILMHYS